MAVIRPEAQSFPLEDRLGEIAEVLADLTTEMQRLQRRLRKQETGAVKDGLRLMSDLRNWLRIAFELEVTFHERERQRAGIAATYAVDFDQARDQIRCRLDRLRSCGEADRIPE